MKINIHAPFKNLDGTIMTNNDKELQLKDVLVESLLAAFKDEETLTGEEKAKRYQLAMSVYNTNGEEGLNFDMKVEDVAMVKKLIGKAYLPLIVGQAYEMLS